MEVGWRFSAVRRDSGQETDIYPAVGAELSYDGSRDVSKTLSGIVLLPSEYAKLNPGADEIRAWLILDGVEHSMGFYRATESSVQRGVILDPDTGTRADIRVLGFGDRLASLIRSEGIPQNIQGGFDPIVELQNLLITEETPYSLEGSASPAGETIVWDGATTLLEKLSQLAQLAGHRQPWMNNDGILRSVVATVPNDLDPDIIDIDEELQIEGGSVVITETYLTAPNAVIVAGNSGSLLSPAVGRWDAPAISPHSFNNRGFRYTQVVERQGVRDLDHARQIARSIGEKSAARTLDFQCIPTPLLDGPVVVRYDDTLWFVTGWSVGTSPGDLMRVTAEEVSTEENDDGYNYVEAAEI